DEVVQAATGCVTDIHAGAQTDMGRVAEHLEVLRGVICRSIGDLCLTIGGALLIPRSVYCQLQNLLLVHVAILKSSCSHRSPPRGSAGRSGWCRATVCAILPEAVACGSAPVPATERHWPPPPPARRGATPQRASGPQTPARPPRPRPAPGA